MDSRRRTSLGRFRVHAGTNPNLDEIRMNDTPDWRLVSEALSSLEFLRDIVEPENQSKQVGEFIAHHTNEKNGIAPLSPGTLVAFAYVAIVYTKEREIFGLPGQLIAHQFMESKPSKNNRELLKNLRNSMSHGDFEVVEDRMYFQHSDWQAWITHEDLTVFLNELHIKMRVQHLIGWSNASQKKKKS